MQYNVWQYAACYKILTLTVSLNHEILSKLFFSFSGFKENDLHNVKWLGGQVRGNPLSTYVKFSEKLTFLTPWYAHLRVLIRGLEMLVFQKILHTYLMDDPPNWCY